MLAALRRYADWLHLRWPAGRVEPLPVVGDDGTTRVPGLYVAGDLAGVPLLKFALDSGARVARAVAADPEWRRIAPGEPGVADLLVVGAGVAGVAAAIEAKRAGLDVRVIEASRPFATVANFPRAKPIFTYPVAMRPAGGLQVSAGVKEALLAELEAQAAAAGLAPETGRVTHVSRDGAVLVAHLEGGGARRARRVLLAIGRSGDHRTLGIPGETLPHVANRLHDPRDFAGRSVLVIGGGDSACEAAVALAEAGARVTLAHRGDALTRPKPGNRDAVARLVRGGRLDLRTSTSARAITPSHVTLRGADGTDAALACDAVFVSIGRSAPLALLRRSGVEIAGEWTAPRRAAMAAFLLFCAWLYDWKSGGAFSALWYRNRWFPTNLPEVLAAAGGALAAQAADPRTAIGTLAISASGPAFWYTLAYSAVVVAFGIRRVHRRRTPYVAAQTLCLAVVQVLPLFLLPEFLLPLLHHRGLLPEGIADALFPAVTYGHGREFWRAYGLVLAWPLNVYNVFTHEPLGWWLAISAVQTLVLIPLAVYFLGKGAYCGWVCSCGALAETLGDAHRHRMPHGPGWNRLNLAGQALLGVAVLLLLARIAGWLLPPGNPLDAAFEPVLKERWKWIVDVFLAGVVGYGVYFWLSGRFWCRFLCPLAAWMHVVARLGRFAIVAEKSKCISCNVCTAVCHQGIDVQAFASRGLPMRDPQCVRCSACVERCPTGVLRFGQVRGDGTLISVDALAASPVRTREARDA